MPSLLSDVGAADHVIFRAAIGNNLQNVSCAKAQLNFPFADREHCVDFIQGGRDAMDVPWMDCRVAPSGTKCIGVLSLSFAQNG